MRGAARGGGRHAAINPRTIWFPLHSTKCAEHGAAAGNSIDRNGRGARERHLQTKIFPAHRSGPPAPRETPHDYLAAARADFRFFLKGHESAPAQMVRAIRQCRRARRANSMKTGYTRPLHLIKLAGDRGFISFLTGHPGADDTTSIVQHGVTVWGLRGPVLWRLSRAGNLG